jgi:hypothetical protein
VQLDNIKTCIEIGQALVTMLGIMAAGVWTYYTFFLGRRFAPNVQARFEVKQVFDWTSYRTVIVSVKLKNIGRTRVKKQGCYLTVTPVIPKERFDLPISRVDASLDTQSNWKEYPFFKDHTWLEPDEEVTGDAVFALGKPDVTMFRIKLEFVGHDKTWSSSVLVDTQAALKSARA